MQRQQQSETEPTYDKGSERTLLNEGSLFKLFRAPWESKIHNKVF